MIIDAHTHVHPQKDGYGKKHDASLDFLMENLAESEVDKAAIFPIAGDSPTVSRVQNSFIAECCEKYPDQLIGFASVHPLEDANAPEALERDVEQYNLKGLKLHPRVQGFSAEDERIVPVVEKAAELGLPVAIDCMLWKPTPLRDQLPLNIDTLSKRVPEAKIIMCHAGGFFFLEALAVAVANDNVYLDVSVSLEYFSGTPFEDQFVFVLKQVGAKRVIYGSDHPEKPLGKTYPTVKSILKKHGFSDEDLDWIFGKTFMSILPGLEQG